jgi:hypothetical protein
LEKWAEKVNATTADKEADKVLKAANIKLVWEIICISLDGYRFWYIYQVKV